MKRTFFNMKLVPFKKLFLLSHAHTRARCLSLSLSLSLVSLSAAHACALFVSSPTFSVLQVGVLSLWLALSLPPPPVASADSAHVLDVYEYILYT